VVDLDGLKTVNDDLGHLAGDELLRGSAQIISGVTPASGTAARIGGDEFAVLLPGADARLAAEVAENLRLRVRAARFEHENEELSTTASIGIAAYPDHGDDPEEILANADLAMYEAKTVRDASRVFRAESAHRAELSERRIWEKRMRDALDQESFVFMAQPLHELNGGIVMYELLLRMELGDGKLVRPSAFLPIAERSGLVNQIDRFVVRKAIGMIAEAAANGRTVALAVNVSGRSLGDDELPVWSKGGWPKPVSTHRCW
jgi:diguanylate cyclase (GGDEF)-like protein